ncbi:LOW QUALITY PROTEIN: hypothetical protein OSB04_031837 [Centaurea solstitialis]|uniref:Uncharacterized protein n=1 Tax=Centaurea solstitialis TaxID=347529 RepID=A0AA38W6E4_9ASTR|nr:LOW QUALITY PROTEIN: hypothetical protein OSB04_031837 [Centaurea solstitialis]
MVKLSLHPTDCEMHGIRVRAPSGGEMITGASGGDNEWWIVKRDQGMVSSVISKARLAFLKEDACMPVYSDTFMAHCWKVNGLVLPESDIRNGQASVLFRRWKRCFEQVFLILGGSGDACLPLNEFSYNNSCHPSLGMQLGDVKPRPVRVKWDSVFSGERRWYRRPSRTYIELGACTDDPLQRSYAARRIADLEFQVGDRTLLKVSPWKEVIRPGREASMGLSIRFVRSSFSPWEGGLSLELLEVLGQTHNTFTCLRYVEESLSYVESPIAVLKLQSKESSTEKVQGKESEWIREQEAEMLETLVNHSSGHSARGSSPTHSNETSSRAPAHRESSYEPSEEYTPSSPRTYDLEEKIATYQGEIAELRDRLSISEGEKAELKENLGNLKRAYLRTDLSLTQMTSQNLDLLESNHDLTWQVIGIELERRIAARPWKTCVKDRVRYYRKTTTEYVKAMKWCFMAWVQYLKEGPTINTIWKFKPSSSFETWVRGVELPYYPSDMI